MVAVLILHALKNMPVEFAYDLLLLFGGYGFQGFLNHSTSIHLQSQI